jgi:hypothetical protein
MIIHNNVKFLDMTTLRNQTAIRKQVIAVIILAIVIAIREMYKSTSGG